MRTSANTTLIERFTAEVEARRMTLREVGDELGLSFSAVHKIISGTTQNPYGPTLEKIERWLAQSDRPACLAGDEVIRRALREAYTAGFHISQQFSSVPPDLDPFFRAWVDHSASAEVRGVLGR